MSDDWKRGLMRPYQDIDCTIPAVNPGDKVAAWKNDAGIKGVQPDPDKQPTIRTELEVLRENYAVLRARHEKLRRLVPFLLGEAEHPDHPGIWFGDKHPTWRGNSWWRKSLRNALLEDDPT